MADFERKLAMLAERGTHVGPEELIERIEAGLADDPLVVVRQRRKGPSMTLKTDDVEKQGSRRRVNGIAWGLTVFILIMAVGVVFILNTGNETPAPPAQPGTTTPDPVQTTVPQPPETTLDPASLEAKVVVVEAMVAARNSGDYEAWRSSFITRFPFIFGSQVTDEAELEWQHSQMAANDVWTITGECRLTGASTGITCPMELRNEFHGPAGLYFVVPEMRLMFNGAGELTGVTADDYEIAGDPAEYNAAFDAWLAEAHPEVHASFGPRVEGENGLPNPEDMPTALEYVDEFIAQSDIYPLSP